MNLWILNKSLEAIAVADMFESLIWTKRYYKCGDFELYLPASLADFDVLKKGNYITRPDDDTVMIIEQIDIKTDAENGNHAIITGRSLESILLRRIIWTQTTVSGTPETRIRKLVDMCFINTQAERKLENLELAPSHGYSGESITTQYTGDNLYDVVTDICKASGLGIKITLSNKKFIFDVINGENYSYSQNVNPYVVFSPKFDNLLDSEYVTNSKNICSITKVMGEGEGLARKQAICGDETATGLDRYELFTDARDISQNKDSEDEISDEDYQQLLVERGKEKLAEKQIETSFSAEIAPNGVYTFRDDYSVGDIVQIENEYGFRLAVRIIEAIESWDENGYSFVPTLEEFVENEENSGLFDAENSRIADSSGNLIDTEG